MAEQWEDKYHKLRRQLEPLLADIAQYHLQGEYLRFEYPFCSTTIEFK